MRKAETTSALASISFSLSSFQYGQLEPNGIGKSTLINIITGSLSSTKGKLLWYQISGALNDTWYFYA